MSAYYELGGTIEFTWEPEPFVVASQIYEIADYLENTAGPIELSAQVVRADIRARFESKTSPYGAVWAPWARDYPDSQSLLVKSGDLEAAASGEAVQTSLTDVFFDFSTLPFYGVYHEFGATRRSLDEETMNFLRDFGEGDVMGGTNTLPARPFAGASFEAEEKIVGIFDQWFAGAISLGRTSTGKAYPRHSLRGPGGRFLPKGG